MWPFRRRHIPPIALPKAEQWRTLSFRVPRSRVNDAVAEWLRAGEWSSKPHPDHPEFLARAVRVEVANPQPEDAKETVMAVEVRFRRETPTTS